uniref:Uncharacterized protein n=1 Tax=Panagrolaimus sp. JU765 TaxID=591449 RepID=A0AC34Q055_9BILA
MGKKKVSLEVLNARFAPFLKTSKSQNVNELTVKDVEDNVLPVIKKLLLREAETVTPLVAEFFQHLKLSSDSFAVNFVPIIAGTLTSTSDD